MEIIELISSFVMELVMLIIFPAMGVVSLTMSNYFSWLYIGIIGILFAVQILIPKNIRIITTAALSLGIIMMWASLFVSYRYASPAYDDLIHPMAHGGFPIEAFDYPPSVMGSNESPIETWGLFYLNLVFWIVIGAGIVARFRKYLNNQVSFKLFSASVIISLCGIGYLFLEFD